MSETDRNLHPFLRAMRTMRYAFVCVFAVGLFVNLLTLTVPLYMMQVFDRVLGSGSEDTLVMLSIMAAGALITLAALDYIRSAALLYVSDNVRRRCGASILSTGIAVSVAQHSRSAAALERDFRNFCGIVGSRNVADILDVPWTALFLFVLFLIDPLIGWMGVLGAGSLFALGLISEVESRSDRGQRTEAIRSSEALAAYAIDNAETLSAMGMAKEAVRRWSDTDRTAADMALRNGRRSAAIVSVSRFFRFGFQIAVLGVGAMLVLQKDVSPGAMMGAAIIMSRALGPMERVIASWKTFVGGREIYARLRNAVADSPDAAAYTPLPAPVGDLVFGNATFFYPGEQEPALRGLHLRIEPGEIVAVVGLTGAGKSSLARLGAGVFTPRMGNVRLGGIELSRWHPDDRGRHIGYVPQRVELFDGSVSENIARLSDAAAEDVIRAATLAGIHDVILRLPGAYDFRICNRGENLPGGIRQQLALARAMFGGPRLLVADEPSNNLDQQALAALQDALRRIAAGGTTVLLVTHNPVLLRCADRAVELAGGAIRRVDVPEAFLQPPNTLPAPASGAATRPVPELGAVS